MHYGFGGATAIDVPMQYSSSMTGANPANVASYTETTGIWHCYEVHILNNSTSGSTDGIYEGWIDGVKHFNYVGNLENQPGTPGTTSIKPSGYWNCTTGDLAASPCDNSSQANQHSTQFRYMDNIVVSTQRIGCLTGTGGTGDTAPPAPPIGLSIR